MTSSITYNGALRCEAIHNQSRSTIETDAPTDNRGKGERFSPTDLTATSLGLCLITTMGIKATDMGIDLAGSTVDIQKVMSADSPRRIVRIEVKVTLPELNLDAKNKSLLEAVGNGCPVARSLHPDIEQAISYHWA